jgi:hypothetical protein
MILSREVFSKKKKLEAEVPAIGCVSNEEKGNRDRPSIVSDGVVIGSSEYVEEIFEKYRDHWRERGRGRESARGGVAIRKLMITSSSTQSKLRQQSPESLIAENTQLAHIREETEAPQTVVSNRK